MKTPRKIALVYQAGIANLFEVDCFNMRASGRDKCVRLEQAAFRTCENIAHGMGMMGATVRSVHCNQAGDIANADWSDDLTDAPFCDSMHPVNMEHGKQSFTPA